MEAKECKIKDILTTEDRKYVIPAYQRPSSWSQDHAEQLIADIYQSFQSDEKEYFIGSMICISKDKNVYEVVDGQQRITTLTLILSQLMNLVENQGVSNNLRQRSMCSKSGT